MINCCKCNTQILEGSDAAEGQVCIPCKENRSLFDDASKNIRSFKKRLDAQLIDLLLISQSKLHAD